MTDDDPIFSSRELNQFRKWAHDRGFALGFVIGGVAGVTIIVALLAWGDYLK